MTLTPHCPNCAKPMEPCIRASEGMTVRPWLCKHCMVWEPAIGRERLIVAGNKS